MTLEELVVEPSEFFTDEGMPIIDAVAHFSGQTIQPDDLNPRPAGCCPVMTKFMRRYSDSVTHEERQSLKQYIPTLATSKSTAEVENRRALMAADWLLRTSFPEWLRVYNLSHFSIIMACLPEIATYQELTARQGLVRAASACLGLAPCHMARSVAYRAGSLVKWAPLAKPGVEWLANEALAMHAGAAAGFLFDGMELIPLRPTVHALISRMLEVQHDK